MLDHRTVKQASAEIGAIAMLLAVAFAVAGCSDKHNQNDYSLAVEVAETQSAEKAHDVSLIRHLDPRRKLRTCCRPTI